MEQRKFRMPTAYTILFCLILLVALSTWLIPAGSYDYADGIPISGSYHAVAPTPQGIGAALMRHMIESARERGKKVVILTCKEAKIPFYTEIGYRLIGLSSSEHGGASWYEMRYEFDRESVK